VRALAGRFRPSFDGRALLTVPSPFSVTVLESQISDLQTEASRLIRLLDEQKDLADKERKEVGRKVDELTKEKTAKAKEVEDLKERVKQFADYDEVKRELEIMKVSFSSGVRAKPKLIFCRSQYVEFAGMDLDEVAEDDASELVRMPDPNADKANAHRGKPLENLLMGKNRKLQDELTSLRVSRRAGSLCPRVLI
jgi:homeobox protein cut-like